MNVEFLPSVQRFLVVLVLVVVRVGIIFLRYASVFSEPSTGQQVEDVDEERQGSNGRADDEWCGGTKTLSEWQGDDG
jgi:hypothetical protein